MDRESFFRYIRARNNLTDVFNRTARTTPVAEKESIWYRENLTRVQSTVMMRIHYFGPQQISKISDVCLMAPANATRLSNSLVACGMAKKIKQPGKKSVFLELSEKGQAVVDEAVESGMEIRMQKINRYLSLSEQDDLIKSLERVAYLLGQLPD